MSLNRLPYIGTVRIQDWITQDKQRIKGIRIGGRSGIAGHLTANEARTLADKLHDLADKLDPQTEPPQHTEPPKAPQPAYTSYSNLTAADGTPEQPLPTTPAD